MTDIDDVYDDFDFDEAELQSPTDDERAFAKDVYKIFKDLIDNESGDIGEKSVSRSNLAGWCFDYLKSTTRDFYKFFEFIGVILLQKILEEKIIRTHYLSSYYCHLVSKIMHQLI